MAATAGTRSDRRFWGRQFRPLSLLFDLRHRHRHGLGLHIVLQLAPPRLGLPPPELRDGLVALLPRLLRLLHRAAKAGHQHGFLELREPSPCRACRFRRLSGVWRCRRWVLCVCLVLLLLPIGAVLGGAPAAALRRAVVVDEPRHERDGAPLVLRRGGRRRGARCRGLLRPFRLRDRQPFGQRRQLPRRSRRRRRGSGACLRGRPGARMGEGELEAKLEDLFEPFLVRPPLHGFRPFVLTGPALALMSVHRLFEDLRIPQRQFVVQAAAPQVRVELAHDLPRVEHVSHGPSRGRRQLPA
mmetsp:Transcript_90085/g.291056  ORF Transcript_90085/g.291056 Transcript_90085/m.291056 type:complete len:299 (+) Transcript_90085:2060-2956(+)